MPTKGGLLGREQNLYTSSLIITNTLNIDSTTNEDIYLDYEAYRFNFAYQYGLNEKWNLKIDIPVMHQGGGVFDSDIDRWHEFFGLPRGNRTDVENNQYDIRYSAEEQTYISLDAASTTLGDIQFALARSLVARENTQLSLWASLKLPTGDQNKHNSNGATDISAWFALNQLLAESWLININAGTVLLGENSYQGMPLSDYALFGNFTLGWVVTDNVHLKLQLQGHTSYYDSTRLDILGDTYFLTFGTMIKINECNQLDFAMNEDIKVNASPDASLLLSWRYNPAHC